MVAVQLPGEQYGCHQRTSLEWFPPCKEYKSPWPTEEDILILIIYLCVLFIRVCITVMCKKCVSRVCTLACLCSCVGGDAPSRLCIIMLMQRYKLKRDLSGFIEFNDFQLQICCLVCFIWCVIGRRRFLNYHLIIVLNCNYSFLQFYIHTDLLML